MPRGEKPSDTSDPIAEDVHDAYAESDLPERVARDRAADAEVKAERSRQAGEGPADDEKGTGALEK